MNIPTLNHQINEKLIFEDLLSSEDLETILSLEHLSLVQDLKNIIHFYLENEEEVINNEETYSDNAIVYGLFMLKEIKAENQFDLIMKILELDEDTLDVWFGFNFTSFYWSLIVFYGENKLEVLKESLKHNKSEIFSNEQIALAILQIFFRNEEKHEIIRKYWTELLEYYNNLSEEEVDPTYLAFFVSYIHRPNDYQMSLIKSLYDKDFIDESVNGSFEELFEFEEDFRELATVFDIQNDLEKYYNEIKNQNKFDNFDEYIDYLNNKNKQSPIINTQPKINRNDNYPCGSGKKYKKCCINE
jgi:SEC-C motif